MGPCLSSFGLAMRRAWVIACEGRVPCVHGGTKGNSVNQESTASHSLGVKALLATALPLALACSTEPAFEAPTSATSSALKQVIAPIESLPYLDSASVTDAYIQRLRAT